MRRTWDSRSTAAVRLNEYFVSHYMDHTPLAASRAGLRPRFPPEPPAEGRNPWCVSAPWASAASFATDALQVHGLATRAGRLPAGVMEGLPGDRCSMSTPWRRFRTRGAAGARCAHHRGFFGWFEADHPAASSDADLAFVGRALALPEAAPPAGGLSLPLGKGSAAICSALRRCWKPLELSEAEIDAVFGTDRRHRARGGALLSFFTGSRRHVVLKRRSCTVLRPHGHILRSGSALIPDEPRSPRPSGWPACSIRWSPRATSASTGSCPPCTAISACSVPTANGSSSSWQRLAIAGRAVRLRESPGGLPLDLSPCGG